MENIENYYIYKRRFKISYQEIIDQFNDKIKLKLKNLISRNKLTRRFIDPYEIYSIDRKKVKDNNSYTKAFNLPDIEPYIYRNISLNEVYFFEAIEIDDFNKYKRKIISKINNQHPLYGIKSKNDIKKKLYHLKDDLDTISWGNLFSYSNKNSNRNNDLIKGINVSYIKTNESFFIIKLNVKPSDKFKNEFDKILSYGDFSTDVTHYNSYYNIIRTKRFVSHWSMILSLKCYNIEALLSDLNQQVKRNFTKHFKGYFHNSKTSNVLPSIEYYEVENIQELKKDSDLMKNFYDGFEGYYSLPDNEIEIHLSNKSRKEQTLIQIIKQRGHGKVDKNDNDSTNYDGVESYFIIQSLVFPCVFQGILNEQFERLNKLKREIYDFINKNNFTHIYKILSFIQNNKKYLSLKKNLIQVLLTNKRFEKEFSKRNIFLYTRDYNLEIFELKSTQENKDERNMLKKIIEDINYQINSLNNKTKSTNEIFKTIEEYNSFRTNFQLQLISIFIAILAIIFTFGKAKSIIIELFKYLSGI